MPFTIEIRGDARAETVDAAYAELRRLDALFSTFKAESAVSRIASGAHALADADPLDDEVARLCREYERATDGYFSAWIDGRFDPTGLVKGWAIARVSRLLDAAGHRDHFVDGAGDVLARGSKGPGQPWRVGIRHPVERDKVSEVVFATDLAVATSGTYEKGTHIRDPHTGAPATELVSLTVTGPDIVAADVYATAAFAMGKRGLAFVEGLGGYEGYAIDADLAGWATSGFAALVAPPSR